MDSGTMYESQWKFKMNIPAFKELNFELDINFILYNFHDHMNDGLIGLPDLKRFNINLNFGANHAENKNTKILLFYNNADNLKMTVNHTVNAYEIP